jgi:hypothetical protein
MFPILFTIVLALVVAIDFVFLPKIQRRAWATILLAFVGASTMVFFEAQWHRLASWLGVGRPVDIFIYVGMAVLVRELILSRARYTRQQAMIVDLTRAMAVAGARELTAGKRE